MKNAISIDLEDWFCVYNLRQRIKRDEWDSCELRVVGNTERLLMLFRTHRTHATFFVLGWIAERVPDLIREIEAAGHEIAIHGYDHCLLTHLTPDEFQRDLIQALTAMDRCGLKQDIYGFRAPSFTIVHKTLWALRILEEYQFRYDSSVFPVGFHPDYGIADAPLAPYMITPSLQEFPMSCVEWMGRRIPCCGGAYFRLLPYFITRWGIRQCNGENRPVVFYIHPWEIDPQQPRVRLPRSKALRHYYNLDKTEERLDRLLSDFQFTTIREVLAL